MAHLYRLIIAVVLAAFSFSAHAVIPTQTGWHVDLTLFGRYVEATGVTIDEACAALVPKTQGAYVAGGGDPANAYTASKIFNGACYQTLTQNSNSAVLANSLANGYTVAGVCPANSTAVTGGCQCTSPYVENAAHTACEAPPDSCFALKGAIVGEIEWASTTKAANWACLGGAGGNATCQTVAVCDYTSQVPGQTGWTCRGIAYMSGARSSACTGNGETAESPSPAPVADPVNPDKVPVPGQPAPARCPAGQAPGTVNGTRICAPVGPDTGTSTPAPGSGTTTTNNSDGSSTTSTTTGRTECKNGQCTTTTNNTTTTINAPGNGTCPAGQTSGTTTVNGESRTTCTGTATSASTGSQSGFCEKNPKDKQCGGDGADTSFGGSCASGFKAVSDDAVLNAMAEEQHKRNCEVMRTDTEPSTWVTAEGQKTDNAMKDNPNNSTVSIGPGNFDTSDALGGGGCNLNKTVVVRGYSVALPFNVLCDPLAVLGQILVAVSLLLAARIVTRG
ncbi:hypothetical protein [Variovorax sp. DXTD-1]|uniref:hypothetical protein n=1 Tax=Variovorax sp. DXTD-1 TaxID=2495592 RepID=UPI000F899CAA|nr:hypothetical protein [Variovorax sp. DXTD-1]RST50549.1 hypothetical protein EJI00_11865 [Variovorax sp. DXTD-1]